MIVDSHQHFWKYERKRHSWIDDEMKVIRRDFLPSDLEAVYAENNIDGCVAVQADQTLRETDFLLDLASRYDFIRGVVGWVDLRGDDIETVLEKYSKQEKLKGFRHVVQGETDPCFLLRKDFLRGISALENHNFTYDILVFPHQLLAVLEFVKRFPNQKFVIDHIAKPYIKDGFFEGWAVLMREIAKYENVFCKVSGMITEADYQNWTEKQIHQYMEVVFTAFGTDRIMFGSDWPVCLVAGSYKQVKEIVTGFIGKFPKAQQAGIMGNNATKFYDL
ncbi:amidohydrolase family protein [uncultured Polaribacter sp.]|uniref:amidohydrolase family protein n=1 Tax=uncultured Polaribacter sp. TaxID=174711 RepID=UPI0026324A4D|nr:amidohydrolase family protein [uncultured Polaribacter sp.]